MTTYYILTAEHSSGRSVAHPCSTGVYDDATDKLDETVEAETAEEAKSIGMKLLERIIDESEPCDCSRRLASGDEGWWNSVCVVAEEVTDKVPTDPDLSFIDELDTNQLKSELADRVRLIHQLREHRDLLLDLLVKAKGEKY